MDKFVEALEEELRSTPYQPLGMLGHGAMGAVFEVEHRTLRRRLVIKILREVDRADLEDRLRLEAQTLAQLSHPNLLQVVDYSHTASGRPFIVSERLVGRTLKEVVGTMGKLPMIEAVTYTCQSLAGLAAAHRAGVVHRDIKLDNIFLCDGDELNPRHAKVIDFGIAKLVGAEGGAPAMNVAPLANPTAEGLMVGTPSFMSPEQVTSQPVDHRADIYGMGVVLYRLLAGRNPFVCADLIEYAAAHAAEPPPPPTQFVQMPAELEKVILRALEKNPAARFQSAKEMIDALVPFARPQAEPAPAPAAQRPSVHPPGSSAPKPHGTMLMEQVPARPDQGPTGTSPMATPNIPAHIAARAGTAVSAKGTFLINESQPNRPSAPMPLVPGPPGPAPVVQQQTQLAIPAAPGAALPFNAMPAAVVPKRRMRGVELAAIVIAVISLVAIAIFAFMLSRMR